MVSRYGSKRRRAAVAILASYFFLAVGVTEMRAQPMEPPVTEPSAYGETWEIEYERITRQLPSRPFSRVDLVQGEESPALQDPASVNKETVRIVLRGKGFSFVEPDKIAINSEPMAPHFYLDTRSQTYQVVSPHALAWFDANEQMHRGRLCRAFAAAEVDALAMGESCARFDLETVFHVVVPHGELITGEPPVIEQQQVGEKLDFLYQDEVRVSFVPSDHRLGFRVSETFRRLLAHHFDIHPNIRQTIVESKVLPRELSFVVRKDGQETRVEYSLVEVVKNHRDDVFALPADYRLEFDTNSATDQILAMFGEVEIPSIGVLQREAEVAVNAALAAGKKADALLATLRYREVTGDGVGYRLLLLRCGGMTDQAVRAFFQDSGRLDTRQQLRDRLEAEGSQLSYVLDYMIADTALERHRYDIPAKELLLHALKKDPLLVGAYLDLARMTLDERFDSPTAWRLIESARKVAPRHPYLEPFNTLEHQLETDFPDLF